MQNIRIDDMSVIQERKTGEDSYINLEQSKKKVNIACPYTHIENYQCQICNRLRAVCPFSRMQTCNHSQVLLNSQNVSMRSKALSSTMAGERLKTFSTNYQSGNRLNLTHQNAPQAVNISPARVIRTEAPTRIIEEIIFVPHIHNKIIMTPGINPEKTYNVTPNRSNKKSRRYLDGNEDSILTPTQFRQLMDSYRNA